MISGRGLRHFYQNSLYLCGIFLFTSCTSHSSQKSSRTAPPQKPAPVDVVVVSPCDEENPDACQERCDAGEPEACDALGGILRRGRAPDLVRVVALYQKACDLGESLGCYNLGALYWKGEGVERDPVKALDLFQKACNLGGSEGCDGFAWPEKNP